MRGPSSEGLRFFVFAVCGVLDFCGMKLAKRGDVNQHTTDVKTIVKTIALTVAMSAVAGATAQTGTMSASSAPDTVLLSERTDGDYLVRTYRIRQTDDVDYSIRYRISAATLNAALAGNSEALSELNGFVDGLLQDTLKKVSRIVITGYASPDGPVAYNRELAAQRATDFKNYVDGKYNLSQRYAVTVTSESVPSLKVNSKFPPFLFAMIQSTSDTSGRAFLSSKAKPALNSPFVTRMVLPSSG